MTSLTSIVVIGGATGSGKGQLARDLARRLGGEIVVADSRKIYRGFDIGTAKPSPEARSQIPHHLIDICQPNEVFTAALFAAHADRAIAEIKARGQLPIVAGGTGLYLRALLHGIVDAPRDERIRDALDAREDREPGFLSARLAELDPGSAAQIPQNDRARLLRALQVVASSGQRLSDLQSAHRFQPRRYRALFLALAWPRETLYLRINERVERMIAMGWLAEMERLRTAGHAHDRAAESVGYAQWNAHLEGALSFEEAKRIIQRDHRRYARRQLRWFRAEPDVRWLDCPVDLGALLEEISRFRLAG